MNWWNLTYHANDCLEHCKSLRLPIPATTNSTIRSSYLKPISQLKPDYNRQRDTVKKCVQRKGNNGGHTTYLLSMYLNI